MVSKPGIGLRMNQLYYRSSSKFTPHSQISESRSLNFVIFYDKFHHTSQTIVTRFTLINSTPIDLCGVIMYGYRLHQTRNEKTEVRLIVLLLSPIYRSIFKVNFRFHLRYYPIFRIFLTPNSGHPFAF